ncbi:MAG: hypothetical protein QOE01_181 [Actinomycetota bacterium]|nr:hypothetical protein [Actinomycetota bacterium]
MRYVNAVKWLPLSLVCALSAFGAPVFFTDWHIARSAGHTLLSGDALSVYADHPLAQMGPLALLVAGLLPKSAYIVLVALLLTPFLQLCESVAPRDVPKSRVAICTGLGGALLVYPWADFAEQGHIDDVLVLFGCALMLKALQRRSAVLGGAAFALAVAAKPTALIAAPLLLPLGATAVSIAAASTAAVWLPFALADLHGFLASGKGVIDVRAGSLLDFVGYDPGSATPWWVRAIALGGGALLCAVFVRRRDPARGLLAGFAVRAFIDPNPATCYAATLVALGLFADVGVRRVPWTAAVGMLGWMVSWRIILWPRLGWPRLVLTALSPVAAPRVRRPPVDGAARESTGEPLTAHSSG